MGAVKTLPKKLKAGFQLTKNQLKSFRPGRNSVWVNKKRYPKQKCTGHYISQRGRRRFVLADGDFWVEHMFNSHELAKAWGWEKVS